jgi:hypothetical protein
MKTKALLILLALALSCALAQPANIMRFRVDRACDGNADMCAPRIYGEGIIQPDTAKIFAAFAHTNRQKLPPSVTVSLDSPGGSLFGGMQLGREIRRLGFDTDLLPDQTCASACALAFLGGVLRTLEGDAKYGVHQFSSSKASIGDGPTQVTVVAIASYIEQMGSNRQLLDLASLVAPQDIYWLNEQERYALRVDNSIALHSDWALDAMQDGTPFVSVLIKYPGDRMEGRIRLVKENNTPVLHIRLFAPEHKRDRLQNLAVVLLYNSIDILLDNQSRFRSTKHSWLTSRNEILTSIPLW